ncbi:zinc-ribbon domain-containing protein [Pseudothauera rhizosphaerae]|uniref:Zinc ribbon domain-containing protein n=1 Tax=Pseudothauera rhizosphaerae TaxID=2565932 RepID=A0A4S4AMZ7_9RHOO|nr:zinc ribbon domain-containing protein [Pseudothauera rhizosphaerae]THF60955.1 zinc ribbon domain-containing protein [Pseudothauera rhizosphaerae]
MKCSQCGHENRATASFCTACGTALEAKAHLPPSASPTVRRRKPLPAIVAAIALLSAGVGYYVYRTVPAPESPAPTATGAAADTPPAPAAAPPAQADAPTASESAPRVAEPAGKAPPAPARAPHEPADPAPRPTQAPPPAPAGESEWLTDLRHELDRCEQLNFLARIPCREKVRWTYCKERWNTVSECATSGQDAQ